MADAVLVAGTLQFTNWFADAPGVVGPVLFIALLLIVSVLWDLRPWVGDQ